MDKKIAIGIAILFVTTGIALFIVTIIQGVVYFPDAEIDPPDGLSNEDLPPAELPERLHIPSLDINAHVQHVGIKANGNMAAPNNFGDTGWYKHGSLPGQPGSAVVAGHVDNGLGMAGVFKNLDKLQKGDEIFIATKNQIKIRFVVTGIEEFNYKEVPVHRVFNPNEKTPHLNLVTCKGAWLPREKTYDKRLVVFARLES